MASSRNVFSRFASLVVVLIAFAVTSSVAQLVPGRVTGRVHDAQGAAVAGATVKLTNPATGF